MDLTVVIPTHNPHPGRLERTLSGLRAQTLPPDRWECLLIDNRSTERIDSSRWTSVAPASLRIVREDVLGLTAARKRGFREATADIWVLVDDDNVLAPDYLENVLGIFSKNPAIGAIGGRSIPEFETPPPGWIQEFYGLLALRDPGNEPQVSTGPSGDYPACAPIGAGMALRRDAVRPWLERSGGADLSDRRGSALSSAGDCDIVLTLLANNWVVGYFPELSLIHLIAASRTQPDYLARLNRGIQQSWVEVLDFHGLRPWPPIPAWSLPFRQSKSFFTCRAWTGVVNRIRWHGVLGRLAGCAGISL